MQVRRLLAVILCLFVSVVSAQDSQALRSDDAQAVSGAAVPRLVRFSGAVELSAKAASREAASGSIRTLTFSVFADQNGGSALWSETQNVAVDADGNYSVMIGAATKGGVPVEMFATGSARWLQIDDVGAGDQPRALMVSVPYALKAEDAEKLAGKSATDFVLSSELQQHITAAMAAASSQAMREPINSSTAQSVDVNGSITFTDTSIHNAVIITQNGTGNALDAIAVSGHAIRANAPGTGGFAAIVGNASGAGGKAISGNSTASSGSGIGVSGTTQSSSGVGVQGSANNVSGGTGVYGIVPSGPGTAILADVFSGSAVAGKFRSTSGSSNVIVGSGPGGDKFTVTADGDVTATSLTLANGGTFSVPDGGIFMGTGTFSFATPSVVVDVLNTHATSGSAINGTVINDNGYGVTGHAMSSTGNGAGIFGVTQSEVGGAGVEGTAIAATGSSVGVRGITNSNEGFGMEGLNVSTDNGAEATGVFGMAFAEDGMGVRAHAASPTGTATGVFGSSAADNGTGVIGYTDNGNSWGVWGQSDSSSGIGGVFGNSSNAQAIAVFDAFTGFKTFGVNGDGNVLLAPQDESDGTFSDVPSPGLSLASSIWNGDLSQSVLHKFTWKNDVAFGDGQNFPILSLIYGNDQDGDGEVLSINSDGTINFAPGQSFGDALSSSQPSSINVNNNFGPALHVENTGSNNALSVLNTGTGAGLFVQNNDTTTTATISNNNSSGTALRVRVEPYNYDRLTVRHDGVELPPLDYPFVGSVGFGSNLLDMTAVAVDSGDTNRYQHTFRWQVAQIDGSPTSGELQLSYGQDYTFSNPPALKVAADGALTIGGADSNVTPIKRHFSATGLFLNLSGITAGECADSTTYSMPGTAQGDRVVLAMNNMDVLQGWMIQGFVPPAGGSIIVRACRFQNASGGGISGTFSVDVWR